MTTLRRRIDKLFGWKEDPRYEGITVVPGRYIKKDPRVIMRHAKESGSLDAAQRWFAKLDKQLEAQSESASQHCRCCCPGAGAAHASRSAWAERKSGNGDLSYRDITCRALGDNLPAGWRPARG